MSPASRGCRENVQIAGMRIAPERLLDLQRQAVHAAPHVGAADRQPHPHAGRDRDHRRVSALTTAAANAAETEPGIRTRTLPVNSTSIAGSATDLSSSAVELGTSPAVIMTGANPFRTARNSFRQR